MHRTLWFIVSAMLSCVAWAEETRTPAPPNELQQAEEHAPPPAIALNEVKTYGDLLKQPAVPFGKESTVHFGILARSVPSGSGVMIYAITEKFDAGTASSPSSDMDTRMGPFEVHLVPKVPQPAKLLREILVELPAPANIPRDGKFLFCHLAPVPGGGEYKLSIVDPKTKNAYAHADIESTSADYHPWFALSKTGKALQEQTTEKDETGREIPLYTMNAGFSLDDPAIPKWEKQDGFLLEEVKDGKEVSHFKPDDLLPVPWQETSPLKSVQDLKRVEVLRTELKPLLDGLKSDQFEEREAAEQRLLQKARADYAVSGVISGVAEHASDPEAQSRARRIMTLFDPAFTLEKRKDREAFLLRFKHEIPIDGFLDEHFLARWWVNGIPFVPGLIQPKALEWAGSGGGQMSNVKLMELSLFLDTEARRDLGVKPGDTVGLQLMYCPAGHQIVSAQLQKQESMAIVQSTENMENFQPIVSNRVDFVVTEQTAEPKDVEGQEVPVKKE